MDVEASLTEFIAHHIEAISSAAFELTPVLDQAGLAMANCLLADNKIIACGDSVGAHAANLLAEYLVGGFKTERPELPCLALGTGNALGDTDNRETYSRQVRALGRDGDTLLAFTSGRSSELLYRAVLAARDKNMTTILLDYSPDSDCSDLLGDGDIHLVLPVTNRHHLIELHVCIVHCLCKLVDYYIFGDESQYDD